MADYGNHRVQVFDQEGSTVLMTLEGFKYPCGVAIDPEGKIFVAGELML